MILRRLEVRNFRKLVGPVVIDFEAGLNVLFGNNEEGKSTLLQALRSAFFDKYNTSTAETLRPYGSESQPEVKVDFELKGVSYRLHKKFCAPAKATLSWGGECLENSRVDEKLRELLEFKTVNGQSQPKDHGIWGMFWLSQGEGFDGFSTNPEGTRTIQQALGEEVGAMLGGDKGEAILKRAVADSREFFTPTRRKKKEFAQLFDSLSQSENELMVLKADLQQFENLQQQLESASGELADLAAQRTVESAVERHAKAEAAMQDIEQLRTQQREAESRRQQAELEKKVALARAGARRNLLEGVGRRQQELRTTREALVALGPEIERCESALSTASSAVQNGKEKESELLKRVEQIQAAIEVQHVSEQLAEREANLLAAESAASARQKALESAGTIAISAQDVARARQLETDALIASQQLDNVATNLDFRLNEGVVVNIGGEAFSGQFTRRLTDPTAIAIPGIGEIRVVPGGDLEHLRHRKRDAAEARQKFYLAIKHDSAAEIEAALERKNGFVAEAEKQKAIEKAAAPNGIDSLRHEIERLRHAVTEACARLQEAAPQGDLAPILAQANAELRNVQNQLRAAEDELNAAQQAKSRLAMELAKCEAQVGQLSKDLERAEQDLATARIVESDAVLEQQVLQADQKLNSETTVVRLAAEALAARKPSEVEQESASAKASLLQAQQRETELETRIRDIGSELRGWGQRDLGEEVQETEAALVGLRRKVAAQQRRAEALRLLVKTLQRAKDEATQSYLEPVIRRIEAYLTQLLPAARIEMSGDWEIDGLRRNGLTESFDALSLGTKEQLSILCRLALADAFADAQQPCALILDDAVVFADDERFAHMLDILTKAAARTQIIFFTCRTHAFADVKGTRLRLNDCMQPKALAASGD